MAIGELGSLIYSSFSHSICIKPYEVRFVFYIFVVESILTSYSAKTQDLYIFRLRSACWLHLSHDHMGPKKTERDLLCKEPYLS